MPPEHMPKHLAKGSIAALLGLRYEDIGDAYRTLENLRRGVHLADAGTFDDPRLNRSPAEVRLLKRHFRQDWLGENDPARKPTTGWWHAWKGTPEPVLRDALMRTLALALGIAHEPKNPDPRSQRPVRDTRLPVDAYWVCGLPKFEAYISWNVRQVTLVLLTPGFSSPDPEVQQFLEVEDWPDESGHPGMGALMQRREGILFVGQNVDNSSGSVARMLNGVVVNNLDLSRGGIGAPL
ncbi:MAG TPA: hypothetical protein VNN10_09665 [Dehalococcoidia bacterium]|nr:hypothetical protein [Dehalococcoidia bacterium]